MVGANLKLFIIHIYKKINVYYTSTDEKVPGNHAVSRYVYGRFWQFHDVEGAKGRPCGTVND